MISLEHHNKGSKFKKCPSIMCCSLWYGIYGNVCCNGVTADVLKIQENQPKNKKNLKKKTGDNTYTRTCFFKMLGNF